MRVHPRKLGMTVGAMLGGVHLVWAILVALGWAQGLANFSMWAHMVHFDLVVGPFDISAAITIVVVATLIGYCVGYVAGLVWNRVHSS